MISLLNWPTTNYPITNCPTTIRQVNWWKIGNFKPITIEEVVIFIIILLFFFFTYPWCSRHHSVRLEINIQSHLLEDVFKQRDHLQGQHILKSEKGTLIRGGTGNEYHLKRARWDIYLSHVITNFEYGGLPVYLCFVFFAFTVRRRKTCGMSRGFQLTHF